MKLRDFVPFSALEPSGLPPLPEMEKAVRAMATELVAMRTAPVAEIGRGRRAVRGPRGRAAHEAAARRSPRGHAAAQDGHGRERRRRPAEHARDEAQAEGRGAAAVGRRRSAAGERARARRRCSAPTASTTRACPPQRVSLVEHGVLAGLLMTRTPRKEIARSNGHARAPRFAGPHAHVGTLVLSAQDRARRGSRKALLAELARIAKGGGVTTYVVRLLDDGLLPAGDADDLMSMFSFGGGGHGPPPVRPLVVYRVAGGKETLVRGLALENLRAALAQGRHGRGPRRRRLQLHRRGQRLRRRPHDDHRARRSLVSDVDIRRLTGKNRKPPLYPPAGLPRRPRADSAGRASGRRVGRVGAGVGRGLAALAVGGHRRVAAEGGDVRVARRPRCRRS